MTEVAAVDEDPFEAKLEDVCNFWQLEEAVLLLEEQIAVAPTARLFSLKSRLSWERSDSRGALEAARAGLEMAQTEEMDKIRAQCLWLTVRSLGARTQALSVYETHEKSLLESGDEMVETLVGIARAFIFLQEENLASAESVVPGSVVIEELPPADRLDALTVRLQLWIEYGFYDKAAAELDALQQLAMACENTVRQLHKVQATIIGAALFLRDFDALRKCPLVSEYEMLPTLACNEIARIILPYWANMVTLSHEYLPMIRNFHYGHMPMVFRGLQLLTSKQERLLQPRVLLDLCRTCSAMFCFDWVMDDQSDRTSFEPYQAYLDGYLALRDELYVVRERMRKVWDVSDSHDDLQGTGWIFIGIAEKLAQSECEHARAMLAKAYYRCLWRQGDKCELIISRQRDALPTRILQMELFFLRAFRYYVNEKWEAFLYHSEQALNVWDSFGVTRASSLMRHSRLLPIRRALAQLLCAYHMHHTLEHHKAVAAMEHYRCMFLDNVPGYNPNRPFDHIPPQTTVVYFCMIQHLTEVWTCVLMDKEEYQNQVVPQLWCYNYYRKKSQGPGEGTLTLLPQVKDQALFTAQQWENAGEKEHSVLSSVHLAIKPQLDSIVGIYKTYAQRVVIVPEGALCNVPWPSMASSNQKWFMDMISANTVPGLGFYCIQGADRDVDQATPLSDSVLVSVRQHRDPIEPEFRQGANELRVAKHHLKCPDENMLLDRPWNAATQLNPTLDNLVTLLSKQSRLRVLHFAGTSNARRALLANHEELTVSKIRSLPVFPPVDLLVLSGHKPFRCQTIEGPQGLAKAFMERGVSVVLISTIPLSSKKQLQLFAYFYTLLEAFPNVAVDGLMRLAAIQLRKTTNVFREWGAFNIMGTVGGQETMPELPEDWKWPRVFSPESLAVKIRKRRLLESRRKK